jgi:hypothetical protein
MSITLLRILCCYHRKKCYDRKKQNNAGGENHLVIAPSLARQIHHRVTPVRVHPRATTHVFILPRNLVRQAKPIFETFSDDRFESARRA